MSTPWNAGDGCALAASLLAAALSCGAAAAGPGAPDTADVSVRFGDDCGSAVVTTTGSVSALETVFSDKRSERVGELPRAASYVVRMAPGAVQSGITIHSLYVHPGEAGPDAGRDDPGRNFDCRAKPPERYRPRRRATAGPAG